MQHLQEHDYVPHNSRVTCNTKIMSGCLGRIYWHVWVWQDITQDNWGPISGQSFGSIRIDIGGITVLTTGQDNGSIICCSGDKLTQ